MRENDIARHVVDSALRVHTALGPGLLESAYEACLMHELSSVELVVRKQVALPLRYRDIVLDVGYRVDLLVNELVVVEVKAVDKLTALHTAQLLSYLKLGSYKLGLLLNFHCVHMRDGIKRIAHGL